MRKETAADGAAAMVVVLRGWPSQTEVQGWGQREMAQELCELEAADRHHSCAFHPLAQCGHR